MSNVLSSLLISSSNDHVSIRDILSSSQSLSDIQYCNIRWIGRSFALKWSSSSWRSSWRKAWQEGRFADDFSLDLHWLDKYNIELRKRTPRKSYLELSIDNNLNNSVDVWGEFMSGCSLFSCHDYCRKENGNNRKLLQITRQERDYTIIIMADQLQVIIFNLLWERMLLSLSHQEKACVVRYVSSYIRVCYHESPSH